MEDVVYSNDRTETEPIHIPWVVALKNGHSFKPLVYVNEDITERILKRFIECHNIQVF